MSLRPLTALFTTLALAAPAAPVMYGVDVLLADELDRLDGNRVAVVCNHTALTYDGTHLLDALHGAGIEIAAIFGPEHGIRGTEHTHGDTATDEATGAPIYSLYDDTRAPQPEELAGIDVLFFDIQDIGCRFYTYISTMAHCIEACAREGVEVIILDRPNPISGRHPEGAIAEPEILRGFTSFFPVPTRHALTVGELAQMAVGEGWLDLPEEGVDLTVIPVRGWTRAMYGDSIDREFVRPSPNICGVEASLTYPGVGLFEGTDVNAGRGSMIPFLIMGAPYIDAEDYCAALDALELPGVEFRPATWTPTPNAGAPERWLKYANEECGGVILTVTDREIFRPLRTGMAMMFTVCEMYPDDAQIRGDGGGMDRLTGTAAVREGVTAILAGEPHATWQELCDSWEAPVEAHWESAQPYLLYE